MQSDAIIDVAVHAARRAASVIVDAARDLQRLPAHVKANDLVLASKAEAEDAIVATLRTSFPNYAILGEESAEIAGARDGSGYKWIVHGIDGGVNFAHRYPHYAVALALVHGARLTHAVVLDPVHDELFAAVAAHGAALNGVPIHVSACAALADALVSTGVPPQGSPQMDFHVVVSAAMSARCGGVRCIGSSALDLAYVAAGRLDGLCVMGVQGWDLAAGALIVQEAGGRVGDLAGNPEFLKSTDVIAATPAIFNPLRDIVASARRPGVAS